MYAVRLRDGVVGPETAARLAGRPGLVWLDGEPTQGQAGRWSFLGSDPVELRTSTFGDAEPLACLRGLGEATTTTGDDGAPPLDRVPAWIGYVAYDATWCRPRPGTERLARDATCRVVHLGRYEALVAIDGTDRRAWLVGDDAAACERLRARLDAPPRKPEATVGAPRVPPADDHRQAIRAALGHIAAGDIYQVNLARRWEASFDGAPLALWLAMRRASPVPLGLFLDAGDHQVLARTMETFLSWEGRGARLASRPIKGTIARAGGADADEAERLRADTKERAEHAMIVDLMRNDLGRVAVTGSVRVEEQLAVEPYAKLSHLVSTVSCRTRPGVELSDILEATFPPGSVTGAPKVRAVEIIEALEPVPRGVYCGCVGHVTRSGGAHWAVAIRTAQVRGGEVHYHAGGGLVEASDPDREVAETELKARVFLDAAQAIREGRDVE